MAHQPMKADQQPPMPDMTGANMPRQQTPAPDQKVVDQASQNVMKLHNWQQFWFHVLEP